MRTSRTATISLIILFAALLGACSNPVSYSSDFRVNTDFEKFKTYSWRAPNEFNETTNNYIANDIVDERIRISIDAALASKGYTKLESGDVDFEVNYSVTTEDKIDISTYNTYSGYGSGWGGGYYGRMGSPYGYYGMSYGTGYGGTQTTVDQYQQGTFVLDIIDDDEDTLVWRGTAEGKMQNTDFSTEERNQRIATIINEVLVGYPPK